MSVIVRIPRFRRGKLPIYRPKNGRFLYQLIAIIGNPRYT